MDFDTWKLAYEIGWANEANLEDAVTKGQITAEQKAEIMAQ